MPLSPHDRLPDPVGATLVVARETIRRVVLPGRDNVRYGFRLGQFEGPLLSTGCHARTGTSPPNSQRAIRPDMLTS